MEQDIGPLNMSMHQDGGGLPPKPPDPSDLKADVPSHMGILDEAKVLDSGTIYFEAQDLMYEENRDVCMDTSACM